MPVAVVHGRHPGPTVWMCSAIHGDELNGVPIVRGVLTRVDPRALRGTLIAVPVVNVYGLINESRYLPDRRDLNRSFPGSARGSLASQMAHLIMSEVVERCSFGLDFHAGSGGRTNLPQLRCDLDDEVTREAAVRFGPPVAVHSDTRPGSLRAEAARVGCRMLVYETGEARRLDRPGIRLGIEGTLRVLAGMDMLDDPPPAPEFELVQARRTTWVRARRSGFCEVAVELGDRIEAGQTAAVVFDAIAQTQHPVTFHESGIVIGHRSEALVNKGDAIVHVAAAEPAGSKV
jgi:predicted deacylase